MAVKIVRQPDTIALVGAPTSAAAHAPGHERAPAALRAAGLLDRLRAAGFQVTDLGDSPQQIYQPDEEHPRARNIGPIVTALNGLKPLVEQAVKSGALPLILGGDCTIALATIAGVRRYYHSVSLVYCDRDADLNLPATSPSGCVDGMVVAHIIGRGAPELVRFWGETPLVREPEIALFGFDRLDPPEREFLERSPMRRYTAADVQQRGPAVAAQEALERIHAGGKPFVLHFDVDVIAAEDFSATNFPGSGGLRLEEVRQALEVFTKQPNLAAFEITVYNPERDPDGSAAKLLVELLTSVLVTRLPAPAGTVAPEAAVAPIAVHVPAASEPTTVAPEAPPGSSAAVSTEDQPAESPAAPAESATDLEPAGSEPSGS